MSKWHSIVISVDPGFGGTGICIFVDKLFYRCYNIKSNKTDTDRYIDICKQAYDLISDALYDLYIQEEYEYIKYANIVIESPHAMGGVKGNASLGRGDVFKVAKLAGALGYSLYSAVDIASQNNFYTEFIHLYYPEVRAWKGQVSKDTTKRRVLRDIRYFDVHHKLPSKCTEHVYDAAGIGLWFINKTIMGDL